VPDYRCCAAGILRAARPREKKEKRAKRIRHEADWREGGAPPLTPPLTRDRQAGQAWDDVDIIIRLPNSNIASTGVGECCAARSFVCVGQQGIGKLIERAIYRLERLRNDMTITCNPNREQHQYISSPTVYTRIINPSLDQNTPQKTVN
jgi:hypothetical protein